MDLRHTCTPHMHTTHAHHISHTTYHTPRIIHHVSHTTYHTPHITHHISHTKYHTPHITHHVSHTTYHTPRIHRDGGRGGQNCSPFCSWLIRGHPPPQISP